MSKRLRKDTAALILARGFAGDLEFEALGPDEEEELLENMLNAIEALERRGNIIVPLSEIIGNDP